MQLRHNPIALHLKHRHLVQSVLGLVPLFKVTTLGSACVGAALTVPLPTHRLPIRKLVCGVGPAGGYWPIELRAAAFKALEWHAQL